MIWGLRNKFAFFYLLLLVLLLLRASFSMNGSRRSRGFRAGSGHATSFEGSPAKPSSGFKEEGRDGDAVFGEEKRKINTGPNPLHNR